MKVRRFAPFLERRFLAAFDAVYFSRKIPAFWKDVLTPS
jgi:hypothetical protein